jgi:hypothetical protein
MMFDALARRTLFSALDKESINLVLEFHGNTKLGIPTTFLRTKAVELFERYKRKDQHFSWTRQRIMGRFCPHEDVLRFKVNYCCDTLQKKRDALWYLAHRLKEGEGRLIVMTEEDKRGHLVVEVPLKDGRLNDRRVGDHIEVLLWERQNGGRVGSWVRIDGIVRIEIKWSIYRGNEIS